MEGTAGLEDRTATEVLSALHPSLWSQSGPGAAAAEVGAASIGAVLGIARSTVYAILVRENQKRLRDSDCLSKRRIRCYERPAR